MCGGGAYWSRQDVIANREEHPFNWGSGYSYWCLLISPQVRISTYNCAWGSTQKLCERYV